MSALLKRRLHGSLQLSSERPALLERVSSPTSCSEKGTPISADFKSKSSCQVQLPFESFGYDVLEILGRGSAGKVLRARKRDVEVAIKVMEAYDEEELRGRRHEFDILSGLDHPHLVKALDFLQFDFQAAVVLSYHPGQTLDVAVKGRTFPERTARQLFCQLMSAIGYLHEQGVLHRDVKAENILVSPDHQSLHLADFNAASDAGALTMTGTMEYSAPEVLDGNSPSYGQDVWGCGLCLHMMLAGGLPRRLHNSRSLEAFACAQRACPVKWERLKGCSPTCKAVISQCLCVEERSRPSAAEILRMRWILDISDV